MASRLPLFLLFVLSFSAVRSSAASLPLCPRLDPAFLVDGLRRQCPPSIELSPPPETFTFIGLEVRKRKVSPGEGTRLTISYSLEFYAHQACGNFSTFQASEFLQEKELRNLTVYFDVEFLLEKFATRSDVQFSLDKASGEIVDNILGRSQQNAYYSVLFYASWCPFSSNFRSTFDALSSMFPQINHLAIEESTLMPTVLSRYGVRSFPSILVADQKKRVLYHGSKDLDSLVHFYKEITGLDPVAYLAAEQPSSLGDVKPLWPWNGSPREIIANEPYLAFGLLFICLKASLTLFPKILYHLKAFWALYVCHYLNLDIFGESSSLERVLHVIDLKRLRSKLKLSNKTRNFQKGAKNARVWASSLTSVSLGESSLRSAPADS